MSCCSWIKIYQLIETSDRSFVTEYKGILKNCYVLCKLIKICKSNILEYIETLLFKLWASVKVQWYLSLKLVLLLDWSLQARSKNSVRIMFGQF